MHSGIGWTGKVWMPVCIFCMFQAFYRFPNIFQLFSVIFFFFVHSLRTLRRKSDRQSTVVAKFRTLAITHCCNGGTGKGRCLCETFVSKQHLFLLPLLIKFYRLCFLFLRSCNCFCWFSTLFSLFLVPLLLRSFPFSLGYRCSIDFYAKLLLGRSLNNFNSHAHLINVFILFAL